jgi:hypothetical protein
MMVKVFSGALSDYRQAQGLLLLLDMEWRP